MLYGPKENASAPYMLDNIDLWQANTGSWVIKIVHTLSESGTVEHTMGC